MTTERQATLPGLDPGLWLRRRIHISHGFQGGCSEDVSDAYDVLMTESQQDLDLPQRALTVGLVLEGADLLDSHSGLAHVVIS